MSACACRLKVAPLTFASCTLTGGPIEVTLVNPGRLIAPRPFAEGRRRAMCELSEVEEGLRVGMERGAVEWRPRPRAREREREALAEPEPEGGVGEDPQAGVGERSRNLLRLLRTGDWEESSKGERFSAKMAPRRWSSGESKLPKNVPSEALPVRWREVGARMSEVDRGCCSLEDPCEEVGEVPSTSILTGDDSIVWKVGIAGSDWFRRK